MMRRLWLIVRHRPFFKCPFCKGAGGAMEGYYEREWSECYNCFDRWSDLEDAGMGWFVGRMPLLDYLRSRASIRFGLWYKTSFTNLIRCKLGLHRWIPETDMGVDICRICYEHRGLTGGDQ